MKINSQLIYLSVLTIISLIVHHFWFKNLPYVISNDTPFQHPSTLLTYLNIPQFWYSSFSFGDVNVMLAPYPHRFLYGLLASVGFSFASILKLINLWVIVLLSIFNIYLLTKKILKSDFAAFISTIVYNYNVFFVYKRLDHSDLTVIYMLFPLLLYLFIRTLEEKKLYLSIFSGLVFFGASVYEFRVFYVIGWIFAFYALYHIFFIERSLRKPKILSSTLLHAVIPVILVGLLHFYWLFPISKIGSLLSNHYFNRELFGNSILNIQYAITLYEPFWTGSKLAYFQNQRIPIYHFLLPICTLLGLFLSKKNRYLPFFGFITVLGILLTKQVGEPFGDVYVFLYHHFPGFNAYREASKFFFLIATGYAVFIAVFFLWLKQNFQQNIMQKVIFYSLTLLLVTVLLWNTKPLITGEVGDLFAYRPLPQDYIAYNDFINLQHSFTRTLWIPEAPRSLVNTTDHQSYSLVDLINNEWSEYFPSEKIESRIDPKTITQIIQSETFSRLLKNESIRYVIVPTGNRTGEDNFITSSQNEREKYTAAVRQLPYLKPISINNRLASFENTHYNDLLYFNNQLNNQASATPAHYKIINSTHYVIDVQNIKKPTYLVFTQNFNSNWKLKVGPFSQLDSLLTPNYFLSAQHTLTEYNFNAFKIAPQTIKGERELHLYFQPQAYFYPAFLVSLVTFIVCILLMVNDYRVYGRKK